MIIEKATVKSLLGTLQSGLALDIAPNHTGIVVWNGQDTEEYHFVVGTFDKDDAFGEAKMKRAFRQELLNIVEGKHFQVVVVEDWFVGSNADTVRKLAALNTVIDELLMDGLCTYEEFYRWKEGEWHKRAMSISKQKTGIKDKLKTQALLEELEYAFYLEHMLDSDSIKKEICFEDICDACGMLLAVVAEKNFQIDSVKSKSIKLSDIKMHFIEGREGVNDIKGLHIQEDDLRGVELDYKNLEESVKRQVKTYPDDILISPLPVSKLGLFGLNNKFKFYASDDTYLVFYLKKKKTNAKKN